MANETGTEPEAKTKARILSLDGGGSKGIYTLGILKEIEAAVKLPLSKVFTHIYGTSTGAIIAALLGLGKSVKEIDGLYMKHIPRIMAAGDGDGKSTSLAALAKQSFGELTFTAFQTDVGVVCTNWTHERPMIFKSNVLLAHGMTGSFIPGFGCTIAQAVCASCSAYPFFERQKIKTANQGEIELIDGGFSANNPTIYALVDVLQALKVERKDVKVLSLGCGNYPEKKVGFFGAMVKRLSSVQLIHKVLAVNAASTEQLQKFLFPEVDIVRVNDTFQKPTLATDFMEKDKDKLEMLNQEGRQSFGKHEKDIQRIVKG